MEQKLRVWWIPQVGAGSEAFYVPVKSVEEGKRVMDMLAAYDAFQLQNRIKPDYCNTGGLQMFDEEENEWDVGNYPPFSWDWHQVGGRYNGSFKLRIDEMMKNIVGDFIQTQEEMEDCFVLIY